MFKKVDVFDVYGLSVTYLNSKKPYAYFFWIALLMLASAGLVMSASVGQIANATVDDFNSLTPLSSSCGNDLDCLLYGVRGPTDVGNGVILTTLKGYGADPTGTNIYIDANASGHSDIQLKLPHRVSAIGADIATANPFQSFTTISTFDSAGNELDYALPLFNGNDYDQAVPGYFFTSYSNSVDIASVVFSADYQGLVIDNFTFGDNPALTSETPEPAASGLLLIGAGIIGLVLKRRRSVN